MCGIAGRISEHRALNFEIVDKMCTAMLHRGPDFGSVVNYDTITLGHRRLKIIDLNDCSNQPFTDRNNKYSIVFNGEIYNYLVIRSELSNLGIYHRTNSDTEVLLNSYIHWGPKCLEKLNGMFSFAIWDSEKKELFIARDRFGEKPFFYTKSKGVFSFASEFRALNVDPAVQKRVNLSSLNCFLALGYILGPETMYDDVYQLEPATYIVVDAEGNIREKERYWDYAEFFRQKSKEKISDICKHVDYHISRAIGIRMYSDVPVGAFLSGGIDSSSVVSYMNKFSTEPIRTYSIGFNDKAYSELDDANISASFLGSIHRSSIVDEFTDNATLLSKAIIVGDQLFADNSLIPMLKLAELASKEVKVVLTGDGADELFAGYLTYKADKLQNIASLIPRGIRKLLASEKIRLPDLINRKFKMDFLRKQFFRGTLYDYKKAHYLWRLIFSEEDRITMLGEENRDLVYDTDPFQKFKLYYEDVEGLDKLDQNLYVDAKTWLVDDVLVKVDRSTMYHSIEARAPYLDFELAEYIASLPTNLKLNYLTTKFILKEAIKDKIPNRILTKKKSGFNTPINKWLPEQLDNEFQSYTKYVYKNYPIIDSSWSR